MTGKGRGNVGAEETHRCLLRVRYLSGGLHPLRLHITAVGRSDGGDGGGGRH